MLPAAPRAGLGRGGYSLLGKRASHRDAENGPVLGGLTRRETWRTASHLASASHAESAENAEPVILSAAKDLHVLFKRQNADPSLRSG